MATVDRSELATELEKALAPVNDTLGTLVKASGKMLDRIEALETKVDKLDANVERNTAAIERLEGDVREIKASVILSQQKADSVAKQAESYAYQFGELSGQAKQIGINQRIILGLLAVLLAVASLTATFFAARSVNYQPAGSVVSGGVVNDPRFADQAAVDDFARRIIETLREEQAKSKPAAENEKVAPTER